MPKIELFAVGASAGGIEALTKIAPSLPADFPAAICVVVHISADSPGLLPDILSAAGPLDARHAREGEPLRPGRIFVAPPDHHLVIDEDKRLRLGRGPKENRFRPAIDPLFRSAAAVFDGRAAGVILSGGMDDGVSGLAALKQRGGAVIIQDPADASVPALPSAALRAVSTPHRLRADRIAQAMVALVHDYTAPAIEEGPMSDHLRQEIGFALGKDGDVADIQSLGEPSLFTCPDCHGAMVRLREDLPRFRCHTGHAYTLESLVAAQSEKTEESLWNAVRALEEQAALLAHLAEHLPDEAERVLKEADEAQWRSRLVRDALRSERN